MYCLSSHWYDGFSIQDLILQLPEAREKAESSADPLEKEFWKIRVETMETELRRRQEMQDQQQM
jgi:hypothetical protein